MQSLVTKMPQRRHFPWERSTALLGKGPDRHQNEESSAVTAQNTGAWQEHWQEHGRSTALMDTQGTDMYPPHANQQCVLGSDLFVLAERSSRLLCSCRAQPQEQLLADPGVLTHIPPFQVEFSFSTRTGGEWQIYCHSILQ